MKHDSTLRRHPSVMPGGRGVAINSLHPAYQHARSIFPSRVFAPSEVNRVLKDGHQNRKIGKVVRKGRLKGAPIFMLTLEERASCPRSCKQWGHCYGNQSQAAERIVHGPELEAALGAELEDLQYQHRRTGFLVRLHVLGDFYSLDYVAFWRDALDRFPALNVFGFTAHPNDSDIGAELLWLVDRYRPRFAMRFSGLDSRMLGSVVIGPGEDPGLAILCPAQTGASECCATCALCWQSDRSIAFRRH